MPIADDTSSLPYRDLIKPTTPPTTAVHDELTLTRLLDDLSHHDYEYIGVISSNVFDELFLFQKIRTACPNTQLIVNSPELLFSHHEVIPYIRGMLVVSSYPLYPDNQSWSHPHWGDLFQIGFGSSTSPSIFNATAAHIAEMHNDSLPDSEQLIEYGLPFEDLFAPPATCKYPAVWISVVGQRSPYPVWVTMPNSWNERMGIYFVQRIDKENPGSGINYHLPVPKGSWLVLFILFSLGLLIYSMTIYCGRHASSSWLIRILLVLVSLWIFTIACRWFNQFDSSLLAVPVLLILAALLILLVAWRRSNEVTSVIWNLFSPDSNSHPDGELQQQVKESVMVMSFGFYLVFGTPLWILFWVSLWYRTSWNHWDPPLDLSFLVMLTLVPAGVALPGSVRHMGTMKPALGNTVFVLFCVMAPLLMVAAFVLFQEPQDLLMYCERAMVLTNGVTPLMPVLFLAVLGAAWVGCEWRRVGTLNRLNETNPDDDLSSTQSQVGQTLKRIGETYEEFRSCLKREPWTWSHFLEKDARWYVKGNRMLALVLLTITLTALILTWVRATPTAEFGSFQIVYRAVFSLACLALVLRLIELIRLWRLARFLLEAIIGLPIIRAFDRLPLRAGVFGQVTDRILKQSEREYLITWQARVLARDFRRIKEDMVTVAGTLMSKEGKHKLLGEGFSQNLEKLEEKLDHAEDEGAEFKQREWRALSRILVNVVEPFWLHRPIAVAFADVPRPSIKTGSQSEEPPQDWAIQELALGEDSDESVRRLRNWLVAAEDYMALISVSQFSLIFAYLWSLVEFLVIGALALLLSITSYPFVPQGFLLTTMGLTIAILMFVITSIVIQMNRNELVSRIQKTPPNKISLDRQFLGAVFKYILPLLFALAALSLSLSDLFRSWFEPIFR